MVFTRHIYVLLCLVGCVLADSWDNFTNNLATDLAPLISLFGEQITTQCMSELISTLDDYIFALAPLGILTAVVSMIRVCGNSTLRAFIGRAQEDPASSELELLSCVSGTTSEAFTESGIARITGNPKILEIVASESGAVTVATLSEAVGKNWPADLEKDANLPNLSLNKGIRRRAPFWFFLAALFGTGLQLGVIMFAILTVFYWPEAFLKNGSRVESYALPMFIIGTSLLTLGMFFCAFLVERSSTKYSFDLSDDKRVYWIQPGNQEEGDQKFPSFVGQTQKGIHFVRSVRQEISSDEVLNARKAMMLIAVAGLTMIGFVVQFVGLRGLHSSITLAQLGSTMVMTVVRTCLRAQRMHQGDNMLKNDQDIVCDGEHELDWLVFHLLKLRSFKICCASGLPTQIPSTQSQSVARQVLETREKLTRLTGSQWNESTARELASKLGHATQGLMKLLSSWSGDEMPYFDISIPLEIEQDCNQQAIPFNWRRRLLTDAKVDVDSWEAMLGLCVWSLRRANPSLRADYQNDFFRVFQPGNKNAHQARLILKKWSNDILAEDQNQATSETLLEGSQTFGHFKISTKNPTPNDAALVRVSSDLYKLAAQDLFMHILSSLLTTVSKLNGTTQITGTNKKSYKLTNDRINNLTENFVEAGLGDRRDSVICILSVLSDRQLLPEITYQSTEVRKHMNFLENSNSNEIYIMSEWLCSVADYEEVEYALGEYAYICLRNIMSVETIDKEPALERIISIVNRTDNLKYPNSISKNLIDVSSTPAVDWRERYRNEIYWITSKILQFQAKGSHSQQQKHYLQELDSQYAARCTMNEIYTDREVAISSQFALLDMWFELDASARLSDHRIQMILDWLVTNKHYNILEWLIVRMIADLSPSYLDEDLRKMAAYAGAQGYKKALAIILHLTDKFNIRALMLRALAAEGDVKTLELLLGRDFRGMVTTEHEGAFLKAVESSQHSVIEFFLQGGVSADVQDSSGLTALMIAVREGDMRAISLLLSYNASLEKREDSGNTALTLAASTGHLSAVETLVENGADVNAIGYMGRTALIAATLIQNLSIVRYLCDHNADIQILGVDKLSALDVAARGDMMGPWEKGCSFLESLKAERYHGRKYQDF